MGSKALLYFSMFILHYKLRYLLLHSAPGKDCSTIRSLYKLKRPSLSRLRLSCKRYKNVHLSRGNKLKCTSLLWQGKNGYSKGCITQVTEIQVRSLRKLKNPSSRLHLYVNATKVPMSSGDKLKRSS